jgi:hypothetical protein
MLAWLLDSDPAIRWQALRDLANAPAEVVAAERARVANEGCGARVLALQGEDGQWEGGALFPAGWFEIEKSKRPQNTHPGAAHFALEDGDGRPSRWNTLRALRVLRWCEQ